MHAVSVSTSCMCVLLGMPLAGIDVNCNLSLYIVYSVYTLTKRTATSGLKITIVPCSKACILCIYTLVNSVIHYGCTAKR